ncbi:MAG: NUDIX domain-containing protein [Hydrogenophaga sp.]
MRITCGNRARLGHLPRWTAGIHPLPADFVEPGETIEVAVRRGVSEEAGVKVGGALLAQPALAVSASLLLGTENEVLGGAMTIDPVELEGARWVRCKDKAAAPADRVEGLALARKGVCRDAVKNDKHPCPSVPARPAWPRVNHERTAPPAVQCA